MSNLVLRSTKHLQSSHFYIASRHERDVLAITSLTLAPCTYKGILSSYRLVLGY
jgi:hypothetical protein